MVLNNYSIVLLQVIFKISIISSFVMIQYM